MESWCKTINVKIIRHTNKKYVDFIETDITTLMRQYQMRMSNAIEITRQFGDKHMEIHLYPNGKKINKKTIKNR